ncbi:MAG: hypothetical protein HC820_07720 [Hydrococcus sp. RM1_1_31]|nr:hypothetical protein [Hydrococcus sp. RM1_1_31]
MPQNSSIQNKSAIAERHHLAPWAIARLLPNMQQIIVARFRSRSDAEGHLRCLRALIRDASFILIFDSQFDPFSP